MSAELFDIVDEQDQPTGQTATKQEVHEKGHLHRVAAVLVFLPDGTLLVQQHKLFNRRLDHSVGGHVRAGEDYLAAAKREMKEELNLDVPLKAIDVVKTNASHYTHHNKLLKHHYGVFVAQAPEGWRFTPNDEVDQIYETTIEELVELAQKDPDKYVMGLLVSLGAYLKATNSPHQLTAYDKDWRNL